ncbi:protein tyrosine phosphatase family protein [Chloroflexota bacterium]
MAMHSLDQILNYLQITETIGTAGQPTAGQFAHIAAAGYELVINLAMTDSSNALADEGSVVAGLGLDYVHIPVVWEAPAQRDLERFMAVMDRNRDRKVFVHCVLNLRVSVFVFLYRVIRQGLDVEAARQPLERIWEPDPIWKAFINQSLARYDLVPVD